MTARTLPCDTLSNSTQTGVNPSLDIRVIMGRWTAPGCRWVYFAERDGLVKIGYSADPHRRMAQLKARLLAVMPGGERMERRMHVLFAEYRSHDEWFHPGVGLVTFIEALHGDDPYLRVDLPKEYARAEVARRVAAQRDETARAASIAATKAAWELALLEEERNAGHWPRPIPGDREAADLLGRLLRTGQVSAAPEPAAVAS
jgi:hypothetical protein